MRSHLSRRAQNIIEYMLVVTAVMLVLIGGILVKNGPFVKGVNNVLQLPGQLTDKRKEDIRMEKPVIVCVCPDLHLFCQSQTVKDNCGNDCGVGAIPWC